jgi:predicted phosphoadenosine phosphosulfate sulfurtransferase
VATSVHQFSWFPWNNKEKDKWVRSLPDFPVKTEENFNFPGFYFGMDYHDHFKAFEEYIFSQNHGKKMICLSGIRTQESLNRYRAVHNKVHMHNGIPWTCLINEEIPDLVEAYPIFDFSVNDIWVCNYKFGFDYNKIYDKMHLAGATPSQMRVASPFHDAAQKTLALFQIIEPEIWDKLLNRVQGAAFTARYANTKLFGEKLKNPPNNLDWRQFTRFLLRTLPEKTRDHYKSKFMTSLIFWHKTGGAVDQETIALLKEKGYNIEENGTSCFSRQGKTKIIFKGLLPDNTDDIPNKDVPSWRRMCKCILKNDISCQTMGFGLTAEQTKIINAIRDSHKTNKM